jgi:hypothetical protein
MRVVVVVAYRLSVLARLHEAPSAHAVTSRVFARFAEAIPLIAYHQLLMKKFVKNHETALGDGLSESPRTNAYGPVLRRVRQQGALAPSSRPRQALESHGPNAVLEVEALLESSND